ncbi:hypothetical protein PAEPH01_0912 [Pancytospora epiphaga]|nr:hypothetical protein PAEPH01_0912 [Pancytospora epiphaga]
MFFLFLPLIAALIDECQLPKAGTVIVKYYLEGCGACKRLVPEMDRIQEVMKEIKPEVKYQEIECNECTCEGITSFPTLAIVKDNAVVAKEIGYKPYEKIGEWLSTELRLESQLFEKGENVVVKKLNGNVIEGSHKVKKLKERDFLSGFDGQWLVLFYEDKNDENRKYIKNIAENMGNKLNVGEIEKSEAIHVTNRFNVTEYPYIVGINHGNVIPYAGEKIPEDIRRFANRLAKPSFESITYKELLKLSKNVNSGEPIYIVLYKNYELASHLFNDLAQQFKFRAEIYKSNDPAMFEATGVHPKDYSDFEKTGETEDENNEKKYTDVDYNQMVKLLVYKSHAFYASNIPLENGNDIVQWIFHTHFSHVTNITNENFYTVFHGIKPVLILLTSNERYLEEFNKISAERHLGTPYTSMIFATLDVGEYPMFKKQVLPHLKTPSVVFYDPVQIKWYSDGSELGKMDSRTFSKEVTRVIEKYNANKLPEYPPKKSYMRYYLMGIWAVLIVAYFCFKTVSDRQKLE